jgi:hypothetical protein
VIGVLVLKWLSEQNPTYVAVLSTAIVVVLVFLAANFIGWLGVGLLGLVGLVLAYRIEITEGNVSGDWRVGVMVLRRQLEEQSRDHPKKRRAEAARLQRTLAVLKAISLAVTLLGFVIFGSGLT